MVMKELHEGPSGGHFAMKITRGRYWMLDIGGQLFIGTSMIIADLVMHVKEQED
jgi:hypothetical protein